MKKNLLLVVCLVCFVSKTFTQSKAANTNSKDCNISFETLLSIFNKNENDRKNEILSLGFNASNEKPTEYTRDCQADGKPYSQKIELNSENKYLSFYCGKEKSVFESIKKEFLKEKKVEKLKESDLDLFPVERYNYKEYRVSFYEASIGVLYEVIIQFKKDVVDEDDE